MERKKERKEREKKKKKEKKHLFSPREKAREMDFRAKSLGRGKIGFRN